MTSPWNVLGSLRDAIEQLTKDTDTESDSGRGQVGIDADELAAIESTWRERAGYIAHIPLGPLTNLEGPPSRVINSLSSLTDPTHAAVNSISDRLLQMSTALANFSDEVLSNDAMASRTFELIPER